MIQIVVYRDNKSEIKVGFVLPIEGNTDGYSVVTDIHPISENNKFVSVRASNFIAEFHIDEKNKDYINVDCSKSGKIINLLEIIQKG